MNDHAEAADVDMKAGGPDVSFAGRRGELAGLLLWNLLLTLATIGIYRFWAKTRVRAFMWRNVKLLGEPLEYLGTGTELLIGFLIALVVLTPLTSAYSLLPYALPDGLPYQGLVLQALYYALLWFLFQAAVYRVRRYRLTRTAWRGVRCGLDGSSFRYALIWFLYGFATLASLGLAYPWFRVATTRYVVRHVRLGSTTFSFDGGARWLFPRWLVVVTPALAAIGLFAVVNGDGFQLVADSWRDYLDRSDASALGRLAGSVYHLDFRPLWLLLPSVIFRTWYRVNEFRYLLSSVRAGEVRLDSRLEAGVVYALQFAFYFCVLGALVFLWVVGGGGIRAIATMADAADRTMIGLAVFLLACAAYLAYGFARKLFVDLTLLKLACATLRLGRSETLERIVQSTAALPGHGEGLADALDVGGF